MKILEGKHNHNLTNILKVCLFSFIMLLPVGAIASKSLYVICNKNAKDSYYGETINEQQINYINESGLKINETYNFDSLTINYTPNTAYNRNSNYFYVKVLENNSNTPSIEVGEMYYIGIYKEPNTTYNIWAVSTTQGGTSIYTHQSNVTGNIIWKIELFGYQLQNDVLEGTQILSIFTYNKYSYLDNAFYYAIDQIEEESIFNWTKNTAIYTGVNAMNTNLGIDNQAISIILTYWLLITAIYIIIDIVITAFTILTHLITKKAE